MPRFSLPTAARYRWDELHPLVGQASLTIVDSVYHTLRSFDAVAHGPPPDLILPYGSHGHYYTFAQLDLLGHRFIISRIMFERVQRELTLAHATGTKSHLPEIWGVTATSAHDLAVKILQATSQLVMGWSPRTPCGLFDRRWGELHRVLNQVGDIDGRGLADAMWAEAALADEKYRADLNARSKLATALFYLLQHERNETERVDGVRLNDGGFILFEGQNVAPTPDEVREMENMEAEAEGTRRQIETELRDRLRAAALGVAERLTRGARDCGITNWQKVLHFVTEWRPEDAAPVMVHRAGGEGVGRRRASSWRGGGEQAAAAAIATRVSGSDGQATPGGTALCGA